MPEVIVKTKNGLLRGELQRSVENYEYRAFKGIPYAKPPVKELRFKDPEPVEDWSEIRDATKYGDPCLQYDPTLRSVVGSEDCLYLNVYTPPFENVESLKPVMMYIHGGAHIFGSGNDIHYGPDYLIKKDIVLVTINYRLGIFGFLNLEDEICTGNQGLKDIVMALKWVHDNIENFGGDPKNITVFGESAGAYYAHSLTLSPMSKHLVHKLICQSGTVTNVCCTATLEPKKFIFQLCSSLGKYTLNPKQILQFLRNMNGNRLIKAQETLRQKIAESYKHQRIDLPFGIAVDSKSQNPFMPIPINEAVQHINIPFLLGCNSFEGTSFLLDQIKFFPIKDSDYTGFDLNFSSCIQPKVKEILDGYNMTIADLKRMYFKDEKITEAKWENLAHLQEDLYVHHGIYKTIQIQAKSKSSQTYFYKFSYDQSLTLMKLSHKIIFSGATHFDELQYLFHSNFTKKLGVLPLPEDKKGYKVMDRMTEMWTNFAKYGNPTPEITELLPVTWKPVDNAVDIPYLKIDEEISMETTPHIDEKFKNFKLFSD